LSWHRHTNPKGKRDTEEREEGVEDYKGSVRYITEGPILFKRRTENVGTEKKKDRKQRLN